MMKLQFIYSCMIYDTVYVTIRFHKYEKSYPNKKKKKKTRVV